MMSDSFLSNAGSLFFAVWSIVVAAVSLAAFHRDLFPSKAPLDSSPAAQPSDRIPSKTH
jgi:hypothetical protein